MRRLLAQRMFQRTVAGGADAVVAGMWIPAGSVINGVNAYVNFEGNAVKTLSEIGLGAVEVWFLPVDDPDDGASMDTMWDQKVPKDTEVDSMDLDAGSIDATAFWEPGDVTWEEVFDIGMQPRKMFHHHFMTSYGFNSRMVNQDPETPFGFQYLPGKTVLVQIRQRQRVSGPGLLAIGVSSPDALSTSASIATGAMAEADWGQMQFIDEVLERAQLDLIGLTEAGAETPFEEATALLRRHLRPPILEVTAGTFVQTTWFAQGEARFDVSVEGQMARGSIALTR